MQGVRSSDHPLALRNETPIGIASNEGFAIGHIPCAVEVRLAHYGSVFDELCGHSSHQRAGQQAVTTLPAAWMAPRLVPYAMRRCGLIVVESEMLERLRGRAPAAYLAPRKTINDTSSSLAAPINTSMTGFTPLKRLATPLNADNSTKRAHGLRGRVTRSDFVSLCEEVWREQFTAAEESRESTQTLKENTSSSLYSSLSYRYAFGGGGDDCSSSSKAALFKQGNDDTLPKLSTSSSLSRASFAAQHELYMSVATRRLIEELFAAFDPESDFSISSSSSGSSIHCPAEGTLNSGAVDKFLPVDVFASILSRFPNKEGLMGEWMCQANFSEQDYVHLLSMLDRQRDRYKAEHLRKATITLARSPTATRRALSPQSFTTGGSSPVRSRVEDAGDHEALQLHHKLPQHQISAALALADPHRTGRANYVAYAHLIGSLAAVGGMSMWEYVQLVAYVEAIVAPSEEIERAAVEAEEARARADLDAFHAGVVQFYIRQREERTAARDNEKAGRKAIVLGERGLRKELIETFFGNLRGLLERRESAVRQEIQNEIIHIQMAFLLSLLDHQCREAIARERLGWEEDYVRTADLVFHSRCLSVLAEEESSRRSLINSEHATFLSALVSFNSELPHLILTRNMRKLEAKEERLRSDLEFLEDATYHEDILALFFIRGLALTQSGEERERGLIHASEASLGLANIVSLFDSGRSAILRAEGEEDCFFEEDDERDEIEGMEAYARARIARLLFDGLLDLCEEEEARKRDELVSMFETYFVRLAQNNELEKALLERATYIAGKEEDFRLAIEDEAEEEFDTLVMRFATSFKTVEEVAENVYDTATMQVLQQFVDEEMDTRFDIEDEAEDALNNILMQFAVTRTTEEAEVPIFDAKTLEQVKKCMNEEEDLRWDIEDEADHHLGLILTKMATLRVVEEHEETYSVLNPEDVVVPPREGERGNASDDKTHASTISPTSHPPPLISSTPHAHVDELSSLSTRSSTTASSSSHPPPITALRQDSPSFLEDTRQQDSSATSLVRVHLDEMILGLAEEEAEARFDIEDESEDAYSALLILFAATKTTDRFFEVGGQRRPRQRDGGASKRGDRSSFPVGSSSSRSLSSSSSSSSSSGHSDLIDPASFANVSFSHFTSLKKDNGESTGAPQLGAAEERVVVVVVEQVATSRPQPIAVSGKSTTDDNTFPIPSASSCSCSIMPSVSSLTKRVRFDPENDLVDKDKEDNRNQSRTSSVVKSDKSNNNLLRIFDQSTDLDRPRHLDRDNDRAATQSQRYAPTSAKCGASTEASALVGTAAEVESDEDAERSRIEEIESETLDTLLLRFASYVRVDEVLFEIIEQAALQRFLNKEQSSRFFIEDVEDEEYRKIQLRFMILRTSVEMAEVPLDLLCDIIGCSRVELVRANMKVIVPATREYVDADTVILLPFRQKPESAGRLCLRLGVPLEDLIATNPLSSIRGGGDYIMGSQRVYLRISSIGSARKLNEKV